MDLKGAGLGLRGVVSRACFGCCEVREGWSSRVPTLAFMASRPDLEVVRHGFRVDFKDFL